MRGMIRLSVRSWEEPKREITERTPLFSLVFLEETEATGYLKMIEKWQPNKIFYAFLLSLLQQTPCVFSQLSDFMQLVLRLWAMCGEGHIRFEPKYEVKHWIQ